MASEVFRDELVRFIPDLTKFGRTLLRDIDAVEDLVGDTIVMAFKNCHEFEPGTNMRSWLFKIQVGIFNNMRRRQRTREACVDKYQTPDCDAVMSVVGQSAPQYTALELEDVKRIIDRLPPEQKSVLYLVCYQGYSADDAARILDCKPGTLYSRLSRARSSITEALDGIDPSHYQRQVPGFRP